MTPLELYRLGLPVTLSAKLGQVSSLEELQGFTEQLAKGRIDLTV